MRRVRAGAPLALVSGLLLWGASAWGCVPQPFLSISPLASGPVGAQVTVYGTDFGSGDVEIRWNGVQGSLLAEAAGDEFSMPVTIPEAPVGLYLMVGLIRDGNGNVTQKGAASFEVTEAARTTPDRSTEAGQVGESGSDDGSGPSGTAAAGLAAGALAMATVGGFIGAAISSREHRSSRAPISPKSS